MKTRALNDSQMAALAKLFGDDEDALSAFLDGNEEVNRAAEGMIHRITEDGDDTDVAIEDVTTEDVTVDSSIELDDEAIGMIARAFAEQTGIDGNVAETIVTMQTTINELKAQLNGMTERNSRMEARLKALESDEDDKRRIWQEDLSGKAATRVTYRPRQAHAEGDGEETSANIASRALANLP